MKEESGPRGMAEEKEPEKQGQWTTAQPSSPLLPKVPSLVPGSNSKCHLFQKLTSS